MRRDTSRRLSTLFLVLTLASGQYACKRLRQKASEPTVSAEFGVFFGGQIQERSEIAFELDPSKQTHGFRVRFAQAPAQPHELTWQLSPPRFSARPEKAASEPQARAGSTLIPAGQRELSQVWTFAPGDPLGVWNIRVTLGRRVLVDRPFLVYDAAARAQMNRKKDAGR